MLTHALPTSGVGEVRSQAGAGPVLRTKIPADVDAPDRVMFDLTARQLLIAALAVGLGVTVWTTLARFALALPVAVRVVPLVPVAGVGFAVAVGRRDGLTLDWWLAEAAVFRHRPRRLLPVAVLPPPPWAARWSTRPATARRPSGSLSGGDDGEVGLLAWPAQELDVDGTLHGLDGRVRTATVLVAVSTVNVALRTPIEQAALVAGLGRWLNGLSVHAQIVVSQRRVDLAGHATRIAERARSRARAHSGAVGGAGEALVRAAADHAEFLLDLAEAAQPLTPAVTIALTATAGASPETTARRAAEHTVAALTGLGARAVVLDAATVTAVLAAAADPYQAVDAGWPRTPPSGVVTAEAAVAGRVAHQDGLARWTR